MARRPNLNITLLLTATFMFAATTAPAQSWECGTKGAAARNMRALGARAAFASLPDDVTTVHFEVKYDRDDAALWGAAPDGPAQADAFAQAVSDAAEIAYNTLVPYFDAPPDSSPNGQIEVGVDAFAGTWLGLADTESGDAFVAENAAGDPIPEQLIFYVNVPGLRNADGTPDVGQINEVASHEFFHLVHAAYDWHFDFLIPAQAQQWSDSTRWFEESTCDWASELVFDGDNDLVLDHVQSFMDNLDTDNVNRGFPYRWFVYYEWLSSHLKVGGDGRWIIRRLMQEFDADEPNTLAGAFNTHTDTLDAFAVADGVDNDWDGAVDDANEADLFSWSQSFGRTWNRWLYKNASSPSQLTYSSYFARAVYLKDHELEEGASYPAPRLFDGTRNPVVINAQADLPEGSAAGQTIRPWGLDFIKYRVNAASNLDMVVVEFDGADAASEYQVKTLREFGNNVHDLNLGLDANNDGNICIFTPEPAVDYDLGVIVSRHSTGGNGRYSVRLENDSTNAPDAMIRPWFNASPTYSSPDIWVDNDDDGTEDQAFRDFRDNHLYVRVKNIGGAAAGAVSVSLFYRDAGAAAGAGWTPIPGSVNAPNLAPGAVLQGFVPWFIPPPDPADPNPSNHFCVKAEVTTSNDAYACNNVAKNNFNLQPAPPGRPVTLSFLLENPDLQTQVGSFSLLVQHNLNPDRWRVKDVDLAEFQGVRLGAGEGRPFAFELSAIETGDDVADDVGDVTFGLPIGGNPLPELADVVTISQIRENGEILGGTTYRLMADSGGEEPTAGPEGDEPKRDLPWWVILVLLAVLILLWLIARARSRSGGAPA